MIVSIYDGRYAVYLGGGGKGSQPQQQQAPAYVPPPVIQQAAAPQIIYQQAAQAAQQQTIDDGGAGARQAAFEQQMQNYTLQIQANQTRYENEMKYQEQKRSIDAKNAETAAANAATAATNAANKAYAETGTPTTTEQKQTEIVKANDAVETATYQKYYGRDTAVGQTIDEIQAGYAKKKKLAEADTPLF